MDTIFAEATPPGRGGVSIVRLSGPDAASICADLCGEVPEPRVATLRVIRDGDEAIDRGLVLYFEGQQSFTGDPVVEFQLHGAPVVVRRLGAALAARGARPATAGEFTRRAFMTGKLDLTEVQGLSDLLEAETEAQRVLAMRNASGELGRMADGWRSKLVRAAAMVMAVLDFPDEETPEEVPKQVWVLLAEVQSEIAHALSGHQGAERVRRGFTVAVIGPPNAGKSTLVNRIAQRDVALVTDQPGTTRDAIEVICDLGGLAVTLVDTAGLRETEDLVEGMGIARARERAEAADLRLHLSVSGEVDHSLWVAGDIAVRTKADVNGSGVSGLTGAGVDRLLEEIRKVLGDRVADAGLVAHEAQAGHLKVALRALKSAEGLPAELIADHIQAAVRALEGLVGKVDIDEYLDVVFAAFCIGK
ncbi:tRNA uridine-5-carboxymethylaminomethyl(34) synthesis GTPase MnmE [Paracoccus suum]|uniref:tRNA modification GTPase MnmE n=1 Tax=Paracoccus suum TaxID=2259340 RepID=A0A344PHS4_9RHOB|nr:tRNA uridine-5-carboxymethylaminomethyl(34) synthesis GTPase MnmE [Paracoccus suum]AXC48929.1 tRNA uridine-5-carboxymethylaminomethyl(34) synthesis GTPase MnmE [Paracoccus suum]